MDKFIELLKLRWKHLRLEWEKARAEARDDTHIHGRMQEAGFLYNWLMRQQRDYKQSIDDLIAYEQEKVDYLKTRKAETLKELKEVAK